MTHFVQCKLTANQELLKIASGFGLNANEYYVLGIIEILAVILLIIPRTGILGTLLLTTYIGGAIATHLEHEKSVIATYFVQVYLWIVAVYRFPELRSRILNK